MWLGWLTAAALAQVPTCEKVGMAQIADLQAPAVVVLGERRGIWPDLLRAERLIHRLKRDHAVTLALEAVHTDKQPVLDQYTDGKIALSDVPELTGWGEYWGIPWASYQGVVSTGAVGVDLIAMGVDAQLRPAEDTVPLPPGYVHVLLEAVGEHAVPVELESQFVQTVAWKDYRMAANAIEKWNGEGVLVVLADRLHVEGGMGVQWQAQLLTQSPVSSVLLADGNTPCYPGDRIWREHMLDR